MADMKDNEDAKRRKLNERGDGEPSVVQQFMEKFTKEMTDGFEEFRSSIEQIERNTNWSYSAPDVSREEMSRLGLMLNALNKRLNFSWTSSGCLLRCERVPALQNTDTFSCTMKMVVSRITMSYSHTGANSQLL